MAKVAQTTPVVPAVPAEKPIKNSPFGSARDKMPPSAFIPTGLWGLDLALGGKGIPIGKIVHLFGGKSAGKTTLSLHIIRQFQLRGLRVLYMDLERAMTIEYLIENKIDIDALTVMENEWKGVVLSGEKMGDMLLPRIADGDFDLIVVDSLAFFTPNATFDSEMSKNMPANRARVLAKFLELAVPVCAAKKCNMILINHETSTLKSDFYGNPEMATKGGAMVGYASSIELRLSSKKKIIRAGKDSSSDPLSKEIMVMVEKNKSGGKQYMTHILRYNFGSGFDVAHDLIATAIELGVLTRKSSWICFGTQQRWQGMEALLKSVTPELLEQFGKAVEEAIRDGVIPTTAFSGENHEEEGE